MTYLEIVSLIFSILGGILGLMMVHHFFFGIIGIFAKKKYPKAKVKHKYGIIIAARNEEKVIGNLIESIQKNDYPQELLHIFIIAHNCTDNTAMVSKAQGATVYEYNNPNEKTKGYALKYLFEKIEQDYGRQNFDGFFVFDADNVLSKNYFSKMNDAFDYGKCKNAVIAFRNSKNITTNSLAGCYSIMFMQECRIESRGRTVCGCSTRISGTGFLLSSEMVKDGWNYVTLTEDWEFSADQILQGHKIIYCDDAIFFDEQPTSLKVMFRQRLRWAKGHLLVCLTRGKQLIKALFKRGKKEEAFQTKFSRYDIFCMCMPFGLISFGLNILSFILSAFSPLFGEPIAQFWINWAIGTGMTLLSGYIGLLAVGILMFIIEGKRIGNISIWKRIGICLLWPIFVGVALPIEVVCLFVKNLKWKPIPHTDTTNFETLNKNLRKKK